MSVQEGYYFELSGTTYTYAAQFRTRSYVYVRRMSKECITFLRSLAEAPLFGSMKKNEECDYDHTLID